MRCALAIVVVLGGCTPHEDTTISNRSKVLPARVSEKNACGGPKAYPVVKPSMGHGAIVGIVRDAKTCEPLAGATVVAEAPTLTGEQAVISDEAGVFMIVELPAGRYQLSYYYADRHEQQRGVTVNADATTRVLHAMTLSGEAVIID